MIPTYASFDAAGDGPDDARLRARQFERVAAALAGAGAEAGAARGYFVPGRVEVLGKHTDYAGGRSLLCAATRGFVLAAVPGADSLVRVIDADTGEAIAGPLDPGLVPPAGQWATYPLTVVRRLARNFPSCRLGATLAFTSDLPQAAGLSSSSALLIATYLALADVNGVAETRAFAESIRAREDLAAYLATVENGRSFRGLEGDAGVGTFGGSEDHTAILCCTAGFLAQYRFAPVRREREIRLDPDLTFVIADSGVAARKTGEARDQYNRASILAARALDAWNRAGGRPASSLGEAVESGADARMQIRDCLTGEGDAGGTGRALVDRVEQFCLETLEIIPAAGDALERGDLERFGALVDRSQMAAERWLHNQVPETTTLAALARANGALAASAFGAGFGGSVWALVPDDDAARFTEHWRASYAERFPERALEARFLSTKPGPPAYGVLPSGAASNRALRAR